MADEWKTIADAQRSMQADLRRHELAMREHQQRSAMLGMMAEMLAMADLGPMYAAFNPNPGVFEASIESADKLRTIIVDGFAKILAPATTDGPEG